MTKDGSAIRAHVTESVYALLADGATVRIGPPRPDDLGAVQQMHEAMSLDNSYLRFFSMSRLAARQEAERICQPPAAERVALLAWLEGELIGVASYELAGRVDVAEIAFAVADAAHGRGVAMLLLEHLVSAARGAGVRTFTAETLAENYAMLRVFAHTGLEPRRRLADGVIELTFDLAPGETSPGRERYLDAVAARESHADLASLRSLLAAESVVVVGASFLPGAPGRAILQNITSGGYQGRLYAVSPSADQVDGAQCLSSVAALPETADLAVVAVPAAQTAAIADECGRAGIHALVVLASLVEAAAAEALLATCRRHGIRLVGPGSAGLAIPVNHLNATLAASHPAPGRAGLAVQPGGAGTALLGRLSRAGIGISSYVSLGDKYDVSGNDMLMWWEQDVTTKLAVLCLESFGNPRKFARTARRISATIPVLTLHPADAGILPASREALFAQAGIIAIADADELVEVAALLVSQPAPAGRRVAVVASTAKAVQRAAAACTDAGLQTAALGAATQDRLHQLLPSGADVTGPVDTTAAVAPGAFGQCLEAVAADLGADAVLAVTGSAAIASLLPALRVADTGKPLALAVPGQPEAIRLLPLSPDGTCPVPAYSSAEAAAGALAHAARHGARLARTAGRLPEFGDLRTDDARALILGFLTRAPHGGWLSSAAATELLSCYGVQIAFTRPPAAEETGIRVSIAVEQEPVFGPLTVFGTGRITDVHGGDSAARLTPLTDADADDLIRSVSAAPLLLGRHGTRAVSLNAVADMLLRISRLAADFPELAELKVSPIIARPDGAFPLEAVVRVIPATAADPFIRQLR
jgi:acyl-CoA synthetase (NDP forming)/GNAT superfamily N-acetyltransferase